MSLKCGAQAIRYLFWLDRVKWTGQTTFRVEFEGPGLMAILEGNFKFAFVGMSA